MCAGLLLRDGFDGLRRGDLGSEKSRKGRKSLAAGWEKTKRQRKANGWRSRKGNKGRDSVEDGKGLGRQGGSFPSSLEVFGEPVRLIYANPSFLA